MKACPRHGEKQFIIGAEARRSSAQPEPLMIQTEAKRRKPCAENARGSTKESSPPPSQSSLHLSCQGDPPERGVQCRELLQRAHKALARPAGQQALRVPTRSVLCVGRSGPRRLAPPHGATMAFLRWRIQALAGILSVWRPLRIGHRKRCVLKRRPLEAFSQHR